jgi:hypothetical protein
MCRVTFTTHTASDTLGCAGLEDGFCIHITALLRILFEWILQLLLWQKGFTTDETSGLLRHCTAGFVEDNLAEYNITAKSAPASKRKVSTVSVTNKKRKIDESKKQATPPAAKPLTSPSKNVRDSTRRTAFSSPAKSLQFNSPDRSPTRSAVTPPRASPMVLNKTTPELGRRRPQVRAQLAPTAMRGIEFLQADVLPPDYRIVITTADQHCFSTVKYKKPCNHTWVKGSLCVAINCQYQAKTNGPTVWVVKYLCPTKNCCLNKLRNTLNYQASEMPISGVTWPRDLVLTPMHQRALDVCQQAGLLINR